MCRDFAVILTGMLKSLQETKAFALLLLKLFPKKKQCKNLEMKTYHDGQCLHGKLLCAFLIGVTLVAIDFACAAQMFLSSVPLQAFKEGGGWSITPIIEVQRYVPEWVNSCGHTTGNSRLC